MAYLTTSITSVLALTVAYIAACATMDSSDGWKPPACIIGYFVTAVSVILAVGSDVYNTKKSDLITTREFDFANVAGNHLLGQQTCATISHHLASLVFSPPYHMFTFKFHIRCMISNHMSVDHSYEVSLPEGNVIACNEFNLSKSVPYDTWVDVKYLNTGVSTLMRHNQTNIELDIAVDDSASTNVFNSSSVAKRSDLQYLKRIWVIAKKMEKATNLHAICLRNKMLKKCEIWADTANMCTIVIVENALRSSQLAGPLTVTNDSSNARVYLNVNRFDRTSVGRALASNR